MDRRVVLKLLLTAMAIRSADPLSVADGKDLCATFREKTFCRKFPARAVGRLASSLLLRIHQRLVNRRPALILHLRAVRAQHPLNHSNENDIVCRVDPKPRAGGSIPEKRPAPIWQIRLPGVVLNRAIVSISQARPHHLGADGKLT